MAIFVRRIINASDEVDYSAIEEPLIKLHEYINEQDWVEELLDAEVRHDIIGLDVERIMSIR